MNKRHAIAGFTVLLIFGVLAVFNDSSPLHYSKYTSNSDAHAQAEKNSTDSANVSGVFRASESKIFANPNKIDLFPAPEYANYSESEKVRDLSRAQLFETSRSTNDRKLRDILRKAYNDGLISQNEYFGELAHMLSASSPENLEIFQEIAKSKNSYGIEVMFASLANNEIWLKTLSNAERSSVLTQLEELKPKFSGDMSALGMSDVYRYDHWVKAIEKTYGNAKFEDFLAKNIFEKAAEPREFLALIYGGYVDRLKAGNFPVVNFVDRVVADYHRSYPNNDPANIILNRNNTNRN